QQKWLKAITDYAVLKYNMHIIIGLHSLPGGVNNLDIGEALFHDAWFYNATNLDYSFQAIDGVLNFVKNSGYQNAFTIAPINEASDNLAGFGSAAGLSSNATNWINTYVDGVLKKIAAVDKRIPLQLQDCFKGASYWAPFYDASTNIVFDSHVYYFAAAGTYANYVNPAVCGQAQYIAEETKFPVFIGEWSLQAMYNNTLNVTTRKTLFDTQRYAWQEYVAGGSFWTAVSYSTAAVDGEGTQRDYWSYIDLINQGVITKQTNASYC
ncbi:glycoside hydrolase, partial [Aureobasidium melanogenum]